MKKLFIVAAGGLAQRLSRDLSAEGYTCYTAAPDEELGHIGADIVLVALDGSLPYVKAEELCRTLKVERKLPLIALLSKPVLNANSEEIPRLPCDDFLLEPYDRAELLLRVRRLIGDERPAEEQIVSGDLVVNTSQAEVFLKGRPVDLTFREYELLKFLAAHPGRMYSRDALLNHVWGYDYFGGDRTVDVHIRRLRGKIEDAEHSFIDTVRNMGYRFRKQE
jgi:DNA-binding response OmpR family regulator